MTDAATASWEIEIEQEVDGRWFALIPGMPGIAAYGETPEQAKVRTIRLAQQVKEEFGASDDES